MGYLLSEKQRFAQVATATLALLSLAACSFGPGQTGGGGTRAQKPIAAYCPYLPSRTFSPAVTVSGVAYYEYRSNGNGPVADSVHTITPSAATITQQYQLSINGTAVSFACDVAACSATYAVTKLSEAINANSALPVTASGTSTMILTPKNAGQAIAITAMTRVADTAESYTSPNNITHADPNPIRYAEVQVTDSSGTIVQCGETDSAGAFSFQLPANGSSYTVSVLSRSNNSYNKVYVLSDPYENTSYKVSTTVTASGSPTPRLLATATGETIGGAFNILDQIYKAQDYMRTQTDGCNVSTNANYYSDCSPFSVAPLVNVWWKLGVTPSTYEGGSSGISYYGSPNGSASMKGLYILGGINGDSSNADMDHFDNSVIIHEFGHYIEDTYGRMDSPGGSHDGNSVIDPRLAWGEGFANFFQGVILGGTGSYRDTYGHVGCSGSNQQGLPGCTGASFNESLDVSPGTCGTCRDKPTASGEGNFREFSVARILYKAAKTGGTSKFSEVWTALNGPTLGMKVVSDRFKGVGRMHTIERAMSGNALWTALRSGESQYGDIGDYSTSFNTTSCATTSKAMAIRVQSAAIDDGSFSTSDQFRNNDFYYYSHPGGQLTLALSWGGGQVADLDLYVYPQGYSFGTGWSATSQSLTTTTSGTENISVGLAAGNYIINVMAYTGRFAANGSGGPYSASGTYNTTYNLTINGSPLCPVYDQDPAR